MIRVIEARYISGYTLWLSFNDGMEGEVNLASDLEGEVFEPLRARVPSRASSGSRLTRMRPALSRDGKSSPAELLRCMSNASFSEEQVVEEAA
ncbi:MAG: DUF2442 domain-containing protein [Armatimonadota bacterium]